MGKKVLVTAFRHTSAEELLKGIDGFDTLILPNDKIADSRLLIEKISRKHYDFVISLGQRPNIKNKVHIETRAILNGMQEGTAFDCARLAQAFQQSGIDAKLSGNAGTSYCNLLYLNGLRHLSQNGMTTQMVFVHIPCLRNVDDLDSFRASFLSALQEGVIRNGTDWNIETMDLGKPPDCVLWGRGSQHGIGHSGFSQCGRAV